MRMNRVAVVGSGGSGKSYVARQLGRLLNAPVIHLDAVYYDDEWNPLPPEKFEAAQRELVAQPRWVIDGNYNSSLHIRLEACDTVDKQVVFLTSRAKTRRWLEQVASARLIDLVCAPS
ncbi:hypothetical protein AB0J42_20480 [Nonomuraea sp. NPDC049649]|uniref:hypothetical protein n=1 Tax=Nonomuraea sp. NPDC049649 TaxID=3155776 RepID=UPI003436B920